MVHLYLRRNVIAPLENLSLEVAANVDVDDGELTTASQKEESASLYAQPCLKDTPAERQPLPYRREEEEESAETPNV
jgi:hypothetical protein